MLRARVALYLFSSLSICIHTGGGMGGAGGGGPGNIFRVGKAKPVIVKEGQVSFDTSRSLLTLVGLFLVGLF